MGRIVYLFLCFFLCGCFSEKCLENTAYLRLKEVFKKENELIEKSREKEFKKELMPKICKYIDGNNRVLFVEEINHFGETRNGLIYLYEKNELLFFFKKAGSDVIVGKGDNNYLPLKTVVEILRLDFYKEANNLREFFKKKSLHDSPLLQFFLVDLTVNNQSADFYEFFYSPNSIMEMK